MNDSSGGLNGFESCKMRRPPRLFQRYRPQGAAPTAGLSASAEIIGDAVSAGKTEEAILMAYEAAFGPNAAEILYCSPAGAASSTLRST